MEWIKFKDKWPDQQEFLIYSTKEGGHIMTGSLWEDQCICACMCACSDYIIHIDLEKDFWMPLPDKPKE